MAFTNIAWGAVVALALAIPERLFTGKQPSNPSLQPTASGGG